VGNIYALAIDVIESPIKGFFVEWLLVPHLAQLLRAALGANQG
jgi:hypothetical protein